MKEPAPLNRRSEIRPFRSLSFRLPLIVAGSLLLMALVSAGIGYFTTLDGLAEIQEVNLRTQAGIQARAIERELQEHTSRMETIANRQSFVDRLAIANDDYLSLNEGEIAAIIDNQVQLWDDALQTDNMTNDIVFQVTNDDISLEELAPESASINEALGVTNHFLLLDSQGLIVATSQPDNVPPTLSQTETDWWQAVQASGELYVGPPYTLMETGATIMDFALPIQDETGELSGVLYSSFDYSAVRNLIRQTQAADSGRTALVTNDGTVLFASAALSELSQATNIPVASATDILSLYEGPDDELFVVTAERVESQIEAVEQLGWYIAAIQLEADAFAPIDDAISFGAVAAPVTGLILIILLFFGYIRPLTRSLDTLQVSAQLLQEGNLETQVVVNRQDEMGVLAKTFNQMAARLRLTIESQEWTIATRTADLRRRAAQLETATLVGQAASASLELDTLMADTVNLIRDKFDYYHASIFLIDDAREFAVVRESTGEVGQVMKARPHQLAVGSNSIVGWVTKHRQPRIALNVGQDAIHFNNPLLPKTQSEVALPLISQTQLLGALDVQSTETNAFDENDLAVLQLMADQVAAAIYNARLFAAVQDQSKQRRQVIDLWQQLNTIRDTAEILETTCQNIYDTVGYDAVIAALVDGSEWHVTAAVASSADLRPPTNISRPVGNSVIGQSIMLRKPILQSDIEAAEDQYDLDFPKVAGRASAPIYAGNQVLGAIALYSKLPGQLNENDLSLLEIISTTVSSAISNAQLITETEKNLEEINRLYRQTIQGQSASVDLESVFQPAQLTSNSKAAQVSIPLISRGREIGQIEIESQEERWSEEEQILSNAIANQAALALENSAFFHQTQIRLRETEALFNLTTTLSQTMDLATIYKLAARTIAEILQVSRLAISDWNREENTIRDRADYIRNANNQIVDVFDDEHINFDLANHAGTIEVLNSLSPLVRFRSDPHLEASEKKILAELGLDLCLEVPLVTGNEAIGIVELYREFESQAFSEYEIRLAQSMANQTATVLKNAQLAAEAQSRLAELSTLNRISETLSLAPDLTSVFTSAREEIMGLINATGLAISLLSESGDMLSWIYIYEHGEELSVESLPSKSIKEGFGGYVVRNGRPVMENRITAETMAEYDSEILTGAFASAYMGLPLRVANATIGVLGIENNDVQDAFSQSDLQLMETIASTLGIAIENQRLLEQTQEALYIQSRQSLQLQAATEVSAASSSILETEQLITTAVNLIQERFALYYVGLFLIDPTTNEAWLRAGTGETGRVQLENQHRLAVGGHSLIGGATGDGRPRIVQDVTDNEEWRPNPILPNTRSELALPMRVRGQISGALTVQSTEPNEFVPELVAVLQAMADQLAIAIENTRLLSQAQARANRQHVLNQVSTQLHRSGDMNTIIGVGLQALSEYFSGAKVKLRLGQQPNEKNGTSWQANSALLEARYENRELQFAQRSSNQNTDAEDSGDGLENTIPLIVGNQSIGELSLPADLSLNEEEIDFIESLVREMGNALNNAQLLQTTRSYSAQLQVAADVSRAANTILERSILIRRVVDLVRDSFDLYYVGLFLIDDHDSAVLMAGTGEAGKIQVEQGHKLRMGGDSMIGKAIASDQPLVEQDVTKAANWRPNPYLPDTQSELALALRTRGRTIGALTVQSERVGNFTQENITVLQTVADQMATAIENASLFAETEERMGEWRLLFNITQAAASSIDSQERLENVVDALFENLGGANVTLMIANDAAQQLQVVAAKGSQENIKYLSYNEGLPGQVVQLGQPMMINDLRELPDFRTGHESSLSQLVVPLNLGGRTIGLIDVQSQKVDAFTEQHLRLLQSLSVSLAATIQTGRLIEDIQEANSRLRELDQLKTQFLANMSHELRTPLNSIIGFSRVILKGIDGPITSEQEEDLNSIHSSGQHLLSLINDILDVARIEAGKMTLAYEYVDIGEMATSVNATVRGLVKDKDIELNWQIESGLPLIEADPIRLRQILLNFLSNAAKFTDVGQITLKIFKENAHSIHIMIQDTGIGIAEEDFEVLFEAFEQVDSSATRIFGGTGLGLPITKRLVELHQGEVSVESKVGVGSTFHLLLPIHQNLDEAEFTEPDSPVELISLKPQNGHSLSIDERPTILVVDDEPGMVDLYERYLRSRPYQILRANSGVEALQAIREHEGLIQLILLDINMPGLNGWDVLKEMHDNPDIEDIPVIVCSIENDPGKAAKLGARNSLLKPFIEDDLLYALQEVGLND